MKCLLCKSEMFHCIHKGTRDIEEINVMKCENCGMVQLDNFSYNTDDKYRSGGMLLGEYSEHEDKILDCDWETWVSDTTRDDDRRYQALVEMCRGKSVLEFGCGNGGFLRRIKEVATEVAGVELMDEARDRIIREDINVYKSLSEIEKKYDVICMFHVIEHLNTPDEYLRKLYNLLIDGGKFICETVNVDCALTSYYKNSAYNNFTFWSEHVILFNSDTLEKLITRNGFATRINTQLERYSLANHMYWLSEGKPGGHVKWVEFNDQEINVAYEKKLISLGIADTLWYIGQKGM